MKSISKIAKKLGFLPKEVTLYGNNIAKVTAKDNAKNSKLILVTAQTSNKYGIGKTTMSIGLADALNKLNKNAVLALREPSMGPVFGVKGGATGGGKSVILPENEINLHFTGDFHAVAQANNLLSSIIDNHIYWGNELHIDPLRIQHKRCLDVNDRSLREIEYKIKDTVVKTGFVITASCEVMAICCLAKNITDLKQRLGNILVAFSTSNKPIYAKDLNAQNAMASLLSYALLPNLVRTRANTPAFVHFGPFANIAHGCNSVIATKTALSVSDYCVTEAGFGSDLGAEKFIDIKQRELNYPISAVVLVVVVNTTKEHGEGDLVKGFENIKKHISNIKDVFGLNVVVAINKHKEDSAKDIALLQTLCQNEGVSAVVASPFSKGASGCLQLAEQVINACKNPQQVKHCYKTSDSIKNKITQIAQKVYGAGKVEFLEPALKKLQLANSLKIDDFYVNIAKTQFSFTDNKDILGAPKNHTFTITDIELRCGAKMIVAIAGNMLLMPGLAKSSAYLNINVDNNGNISGIF